LALKVSGQLADLGHWYGTNGALLAVAQHP
jgi:hypothetical protein